MLSDEEVNIEVVRLGNKGDITLTHIPSNISVKDSFNFGYTKVKRILMLELELKLIKEKVKFL